MKSRLVLALAFCVIGTATTQAQSQPPGEPGGGGGLEEIHFTAWVDPVGGIDGTTPIDRNNQVNDPDAPFKTLQAAIDAMQRVLVDEYQESPIDIEGTVYCLPGVYGPTTDGDMVKSCGSETELIKRRVP